MTTLSLPDQQQRERALDPSLSFIVQAPAGSGKTELLTQRFLALLAHVRNAPEEVVAITFTRKAAAEMRARILQALMNAHHGVDFKTSHEQKTRQLSLKVLERNQALAWNLLENPNRLRIFTIDSLCARITARMPILTHFGMQPKISDAINNLYETAAREILASLEHDQPWSQALANLLLHLDNDHSKAERLLIDMLSRRDQWLQHIMSNNPRESLEHALANIIITQLNKLQLQLKKIDLPELFALLQYAITNCQNMDIDSPLLVYQGNETSLPKIEVGQLSEWRAIGNFLLTKDNNWRKKITVNEGFPAPSNALDDVSKHVYQSMKQRMTALLMQLNENESLRQELQNTLELPPANYSDEQWEIISSLVTILPVLVAHLHVLFKQYGFVDYTEITLKAISALGTPENPTDLALSLDYQIQHLLVDEFQDTSVLQFRLLEQLTAGWQPNDGHTIFLVGDPMQSIYRFRKAEVGLFLQAQQFGIGNITLESLQLTANFRSRSDIITWVNNTFQEIFPTYDDLATGAIHFSHSDAIIQSNESRAAIHVHPFINGTAEQQALAVAEIITATKNLKPNASIAILVQARSHLAAIIPMLKEKAISYRAIEIESLALRPVVQDLLALTKALIFPADRIAWLSLLRAPWCGLKLADLYLIATKEKYCTLWDELKHYQDLELSDDANIRLARIVPTLSYAMNKQQRTDFATWIENTWLCLGGPAVITSADELANAHSFFTLLAKQTANGDVEDIAILEQELMNLTATTTSADVNAVEVMTIHKAKGLEFDTVILPCLEKQTRSDSHQLLLWQERPLPDGSSDLILAPIKKTSSDPIYDYLRKQESNKAKHEIKRLLYVAITRAKNALHFLGKISSEDDEYKSPPSNSFLEQLWPAINSEFMATRNTPEHQNDEDEIVDSYQPILLRRLPASWQHPIINNDITLATAQDNRLQTRYLWQPDPARQIGTAIHRMIYHITTTNPSSWNSQKIKSQREQLRQLLTNLHVIENELPHALQAVEIALNNILTDERGLWIINPEHKNSAAEYQLSAVVNAEVKNYIIDRTFIENGVRWIIDYKTAMNHGDDLTTFLQAEKQRHSKQLEEYAYAFRLQEQYPIRLALYYPFLKEWCEWEYLEKQ